MGIEVPVRVEHGHAVHEPRVQCGYYPVPERRVRAVVAAGAEQGKTDLLEGEGTVDETGDVEVAALMGAMTRAADARISVDTDEREGVPAL